MHKAFDHAVALAAVVGYGWCCHKTVDTFELSAARRRRSERQAKQADFAAKKARIERELGITAHTHDA